MAMKTTTVASTWTMNTSAMELPLALNHHSKTIDAGRNGHTLSCGPLGDILQLSCYHPVHGMVVACPFAQFDGKRFHDPQYVRDYRKKLMKYVRSGAHGFGLIFDGDISNLSAGFLDNQFIQITYSIGDIQFSTEISISEEGCVTQYTVINAESSRPAVLDYALSLQMSVNRASYGQLTEGGPIPIPESKNDLRLSHSGYRWTISNENLHAMVEGSLFENGQAVYLGDESLEEVVVGQPITKFVRRKLHILPGQPCTLSATFTLKPGTTASLLPPRLFFPTDGVKGCWKLESSEMSLIIRRNLEYVLGNCTFPIEDDAVCFITDHVALPLGWNRDNYWQIRFLLDVYRNLETIAQPETAKAYAQQIRESVKGHLKWVFRKAQRPHGYWHRSYLANGVPKDGPVFQQDQQCYPLLEICDFYAQFPEESDFVESLLADQTIPLILSMLEGHRDFTTGLYITDETPGDDAVEYPFHFSSHVLLWHTIQSLSSLYKSFPAITIVSHSALDSLAIQIKAATVKNFVGAHPQTKETLFAYLTDGAGEHTFYHDANDIPTLFALEWGFLSTPSLLSTWKRTMKFGVSVLNDGGYYANGEFGGLGSVHTKGPWPLGYAQEFMYASLVGDIGKKNDAWRRIKGSMFWDGLFPEAVDCNTGDCVSKAWFSWPGSMIGSALLNFGIKPAVKASI